MKNVMKEKQIEQDLKTRTCVLQIFKSGDNIGVSLIQRKCRCGYFSASRVLKSLIEDKLVQRGKKAGGISKML